MLDDLEQTRIQTSNRIRAAEVTFGMPLPHLYPILEAAQRAEDLAEIEMRAAWRHHPLVPWAKTLLGLGGTIRNQTNLMRLISTIDHPRYRALGEFVNTEERDHQWRVTGYEPRTCGQFLAYCGHGDPKRKRRKGMTQEELFKAGNVHAKTRVHLIAEAMLKAGNREHYDREKARALALEWTKGHAHNSGLRVQGREFLKLLYDAAVVIPEPRLEP